MISRKMDILNTNEKKILNLLQSNADDPLTYQELASHVGVSSTNTVAYYIKKLQRLGYLRINPNNSRDYNVLKEPDEQIAYLPIYAIARCGAKGIQNEDAIIENIAISSDRLPYKSKDMVLVKAKGDSMEPQIADGDLVLVRRIDNNYADDNSIIVATTPEKGTMIKKLRKDNGSKNIFLVSLNQKYTPISVTAEDLKIHGIVKGTLFNFY